MTGDPAPLRERLRALAAFAPALTAPDFRFSLPFRGLSETAAAFVTTVHEAGWIDPQLDWGKWSDTAEALRLRDDPSALATATPEQLSHLLTALVRADRFSNGVLAEAHQSGLLGRILDRAAALEASIDEGG